MKCFTHPNTAAAARCASCQCGLCAACDHRIKGVPYCQDCIVAGIENLQRNINAGAAQARPGHESRSPLIAGLFGIVPGLGAAYNGQNVKSLAHFSLTVSLWQLADIFARNPAHPFFLGGVAFYLYSIYDAVRAAQRARAGEDLRAEDEALKRSMRAHTTTWGLLLLGVGVVTLFDLFFPYQLHRYWPFLLILGGLYLLRNFHARPSVQTPAPLYQNQMQPPSVISAPYERAESNLVSAESRFAEGRFDKWR
jgi:hypothetical protein